MVVVVVLGGGGILILVGDYIDIRWRWFVVVYIYSSWWCYILTKLLMISLCVKLFYCLVYVRVNIRRKLLLLELSGVSMVGTVLYCY